MHKRRTPHIKRFAAVLAIILVASVTLATKVLAGNPFYPLGIVYYKDATTGKQNGDATTPNSLATAYSYRNNVDGTPGAGNVATNFCQSDSPANGQIFAADGAGTPAYTSWDVGSSCWTSPAAVNDQAMIVLETRQGLNNWNGPAWVGGAKVSLTAQMVGNAEADFRDIVMEPIPTPALQSNTTTSITIHWQGLWDNTTGDSSGAGPASVAGYSIYRSVDGGSYSLLTSVAQSAGGNIAYTDSGVSSGHNYTYKLGVRFSWQAHSSGYYEPTAQGPASASLATGVPQPVMVKFISAAPSFAAGSTSAVQTIQSSDAGGNSTNVTSDTTVNLTTSSTGLNAKFFAVSAGACTSTPITSVTILNGTSTAQFCYYDEKSGSWTLTASVAGWSPGTQTATVNTSGTLGALSLSLTSAQKDRIAFTGANTLTAIDTFGNTMSTFNPATNNITFAVSPGTAVPGGLNGTGGAQLTQAGDFSGGVANLAGKLKLSGLVGTYTVSVSSASGKSSSALVTLAGGALDHFDFSLTTPQAIATPFTGSNTLIARDADNNVVTDFNAATTNVTISETTPTGTVSGLGSGANNVLNRSGDFVNGTATITGAMQYIGPASVHTFKAVAGSVTSTSNSVSFNPGPFAKFGLNFTSPQQNAAPFTTAIILAQDVYGNTVTSYDASTNNVNLSVSGTGSLNTTQLTTNGAFANGVATLSGNLTFTGKTGSHTITATSADGKTGTATVTITAGTPTTASVVNGTGSNATAIGNTALTADQTLQMWAAGYDVSNNWTGLLTGTWANTGNLAPNVAASGTSTFTFAPTTAPASGTITFSGSGLTAATGTITVSPGALNKFVVTAPATATAGTPFTIDIAASDADGNTLTSFGGAQTLTFSGPGNGQNGATPTYPTGVTFTNGVASNVSVTLVKAESTKITATKGAVSGTSGTIVVSAASPNTFSVSAPSSATAGVPFSVTITAYDQYGNSNASLNGGTAVTFSNPGNAPDGTQPLYPNTVSFTNGVGVASITLYKLEITTLKAVKDSLSGTSGAISVAAGPAATIAQVSGDHQTGPVSQMLAQPLVVIVKDAYQNPVRAYTVSFGIQFGAGTVGDATAVTANDGTAQTTWTLGSTPGTDNNVAQASSTGLSGSPVSFTASASGNGFIVVAPSTVSTGTAFPVQITLVDMNGATVTSYNGTKTIVFSGPHKGPNGDAPVYPVSVTFVNGVATPAPNVTLVAVETTVITAKDESAGLSGTSDPFTVTVGAPAKLTIVSPPQAISVNQISAAISVCVQDQYGNAAITLTDRTLNFSGTGAGSQFSTSTDGPWTNYTTTLNAGLNCMDFYYRDSYAGARSITVASSGLVDGTQAIIVNASPQPAPSTTTTTTETKSPQNPQIITRTVTIYVDRPTKETSAPSASPTTTVTVPVVPLPIISSPTQDAFVSSIDGNVAIQGTAPPQLSLRILGDNGTVLGSTISDATGQWRLLVDQKKFNGAQQSIYPQLLNGTRGASVQFALKQPTLLESLLESFMH